jgi:SagB-type dehydrogenase family enzyme
MSGKNLSNKFLAVGIVSIAILAAFVLPVRGKEPQDKLSIGERFHYETSATWTGVLGDVLRGKPKKPPQYKNYPDAKKLQLPQPEYQGLTVEQAVKQRRSRRNYSDQPLTMAQLSQLLFAAHGVTDKASAPPRRAVPSAGALYPFEIYAVVNNVQDLPQGIYHYSVLEHSLELVKPGDFRKDITAAGLQQGMLGEAGVTFIMSAIFDRTRHKYGERGFRYVYIEAGHISQNIYLQATSLGLGSVCVGAFLDEQVNQLIGVDGRTEAVIYIHAVGSL